MANLANWNQFAKVFFANIFVYLDEIRAHVIWHIRIRKVSKCLWSKVLAFEWWLTCDYKCSTGWLNSIEQSLRKNKIGFNALAHGACSTQSMAELNHISLSVSWKSCDKQPKTWFWSASHKVTVARYTEFYRACTKICRKALDSPKFFSPMFQKYHFAKVFNHQSFLPYGMWGLSIIA